MAIELVITSLWVIGSEPMRRAMVSQEQLFTPLVQKTWERVLLAITDVFELFRSTKSKAAVKALGARLDVLRILCDAMTSIFTTNALSELVETPAAILELMWILWLSGGPRMFEICASSRFNISAGQCLYQVLNKFWKHGLAYESALAATRLYGGLPTLTIIALSAFRCCTFTQGDDIMFHILPFVTFAPTQGRASDDFAKTICDSDGIPVLIDGLVRLTPRLRGPGRKLVFNDASIVLFTVLNLASKDYRVAE